MKSLIIRSSGFILLLSLIHLGLREFLDSKTFVELRRSLTFSQYYAHPDSSLDIVVMGSSHAFCSIDPKFVLDQTQLKAFNFGTGKQSMANSYYILREVLKTQKPKVVLQEIYYPTYLPEFEEIREGLGNLKNFSLDTTEIFQNFATSEKLKYYLPYLNLDKSINAVIIKLSGKTRKPIIEGFEWSIDTLSHSSVDFILGQQDPTFIFDSLFYANTQYFQKIINLCQSKGIRLIFFSAPMLKYPQNYQQIHDYFKAFLSQHGYPYYDFGVSKQIKWNPSRDFQDPNHLNVYGAQKLTTEIIKLILDSSSSRQAASPRQPSP